MEHLATFFEEEGHDVNPKLKQVVGSVITSRHEAFREAAISNRVSLPRYVDMSWAINMKKASSEIPSMSIPTVLLELEVEEQPTWSDQIPSVDKVSMELSKASLETLLDGLGKIKDQLSAMG